MKVATFKAKTVSTIQDRIKQMMNPSIYGKGVKRVKLIQTHASWVFIAGGFAYKVKKPVNFGFLNYKRLSARRFFCCEELRLNRLFSPDLYLAVLPITETRTGLRLGGKGRVIDYCVKMRALPQLAIMTERLKKGKVGFREVDELARIVADFHRRAERGRRVTRYGSVRTIRFNWEENFAQTAEFIGKTLTRTAFQETRSIVERFIVENEPVFRQRCASGFVRRCHGDFHSKNVFIVGRVYVFDCIEFNRRFPCCDVASEVAFMAMDLDYFHRHDLANFFVERYMVYSGDTGFIRLLNFYKCYRAYVRGKVTSFQLNDPWLTGKARVAVHRSANRYFELALQYARLLVAKPWLLVVFGLPGTGKSYLAKRFAEKTFAAHLLSDSIRKQLADIGVWTHRFADYRQGIYSPEMTKKTYDELFRRAEVFLKSGERVILDATFPSEDSRNRCRELAARLKVPARLVFVHHPEAVALRRLTRRRKTETFSDANVKVYRAMKERFIFPKGEEEVIKINTAKPLKESLSKIERALLHL